jgi:PKD repeat protein
MKKICQKPMRKTLAVLTAVLMLGGLLAASAQSMYQMQSNYPAGTLPPYNAGGGVPAQALIATPVVTSSNCTISWYGMKGSSTIQGSTNLGGTWINLANVTATNYAWAANISNSLGGTASFRLRQLNSYLAQSTCAGCHQDEYVEWTNTAHSSAIKEILNSNGSFQPFRNASCLPCHTVGDNQPTGYVFDTNITSANYTSPLANVGCEACHGPGALHKASSNKSVITPVVSIDPAICGSCHQGSHHPTYEEYSESPHAQVLADVNYGFSGGVYYPDKIAVNGTNVYGYYVTTNANLTLKTNIITSGIMNSLNGPQTLPNLWYANVYDPGQDRQASCGICHSAATRQAMMNNYEANLAGISKPLALPAQDSAGAWGAACATCHDPHGSSNLAQMRNPLSSTNYYTMATTTDKRFVVSTNNSGQLSTNVVFYNTTFNGMYNPNINICGQCHNTRGARWDGRSYGLITNNAVTNIITPGGFVNQTTYTTNVQVFTNISYGYIWSNGASVGVTNITITTNRYVIPQVTNQVWVAGSTNTTTNGVITIGLTANVSFARAPHPTSQYNTLIGVIQDDYLGGTNTPVTHRHSGYWSTSTYNTNQCATCHVPVGLELGANITGHTFELKTNGCYMCHGSIPNIEEQQASTKQSLTNVVLLLNRWATNAGPALFGANYSKYLQNGWEFTAPGGLALVTNVGPSSSDQLKVPDPIKQARFDIYEVLGDASYGVHNPSFTSRLLSDASTKVNGALVGVTNSAYFTADSTTAYTPMKVNFSSYGMGVSAYSWDFGDGGTSTSANPSYTYASPGTNTVTLTVTTAGGLVTYIRTNYIKAYVQPYVSFVATTPVTGEMPLTVSFTNTSTSLASVTYWRWTFGSQTINVTNLMSYTYTFTNPGTFNVALRAYTPVGNLTATTNGYVVCTTNAAYFDTTNATSGYAPLTNTFRLIGAGGSSYSWTFGDGGTSTDAAPVHVYGSAGTNTVSLTVGTAGGPVTYTRLNYIKAYDLPAVSFIGGPSLSGAAPLSVSFTNTSINTNSVTSWRWSFGSATVTTNVPVYTYTFTNTTPTNYTVQLRATTPAGTITTTNASYITITP